MDIVELQVACGKLLSALRKLEETASFIVEGLPEYDISGGALVDRINTALDNADERMSELRGLLAGGNEGETPTDPEET